MDMRRKDRQVTDPEQIYDILSRCNTMALGMNGDTEPYIIPMTFGSAFENGQITIYFHSAQGGRKWEILNKDPHVCVEAHIYYSIVKEDGRPSAKYESVIGTGVAVKIEDKKEKLAAMKTVLTHYEESGFPSESCKGMSKCDLFKVVLTNVTGKHNLDR